jgi:hypothetical protein
MPDRKLGVNGYGCSNKKGAQLSQNNALSPGIARARAVADVIEALAAQDVAATDIPVSQAAARDRFNAGREDRWQRRVQPGNEMLPKWFRLRQRAADGVAG